MQESCTENVPFLARILETLQDIFPWEDSGDWLDKTGWGCSPDPFRCVL